MISGRNLPIAVLSLAATVALALFLGPFKVASGAPLPPPPSPAPPQAGHAPFTMPSADTATPRQGLEVWGSAALFRLEATRIAAAEAPLPAGLKQKLDARVGEARDDIDAAGARYSAGEIRFAAARQAVEAVTARLTDDLAAMLGDKAAAFAARVDKTMGDVQLFAGSDPDRALLFLTSSVKLDASQQARINSRLRDAARRVSELERNKPADMLFRRHQAGFETRAAVRAILTPEQIKAFDGPFESSGVAVVPPGAVPSTGPTTRQVRVGLSEAQAIALTRLEALRYAVVEGPYPADVKAALTSRISDGTARVKGMPSTGPASGFAGDDDRVGRIYTSVLVEVSQSLAGTSQTPKDQAADLIRRQGRIYQDITALSTGKPWQGKAVLRSLDLTRWQETRIDRILSDGAQQLSALDARPGRSPLAFDADPGQRPKERYADFFASDPTLGPAARSLGRRKVAFETRAAIRAVLTPEQQAAWDAADPTASD